MADNKITFMFGAGVEMCYGLPSGSVFTKETLLTKREKLYEALTKFYKTKKDFADKYISKFHFTKNSVEFYKIIYKAINSIDCAECNNQKECRFDFLTSFNFDECEIENLETTNEEWKKFKSKVKELDMYENIISESSCKTSNADCIMNHLIYYGSIENLFSSIANPKMARKNDFWKVINYYWSAWFSIVLPIIIRSQKYKIKVGDNKYKFVLENLYEIINYIYSDEILVNYDYNTNEDYYAAIKSNFTDVNVITTNYTPFCKVISENTAFLAGELNKFELPNEFTVKDVENICENDFVFPFIMTQAPIKPIINTYQLREYHKTMNFLDNSNTLIVLGYSFCEGDNHINAIIREYIVENKVKMIYCSYAEKDKFDNKEIKKQLKTSLKINDENFEGISIIENNGNPKVLINAIKREIEKITKEGKINVE